MSYSPHKPPRSLMAVTALIFAVMCWAPAQQLFADELRIGNFSERNIDEGLPSTWEPLLFPNIERHTRYKLIKDDSGTVVQAVSDNSASGLIRRLQLDPGRFPIIKWQWKVDHILDKGDLRQKQGDDYAARIYVAFAFEPDKATWWERVRYNSASLFAGEKLPGSALNYIWANKAKVGTIAPNPYTSETRMIVVQSGPSRCGQWVAERRNIVKDYQSAFGRQPPQIIGVAIMTDTDNTGEKATAYYGDILLQTEQ